MTLSTRLFSCCLISLMIWVSQTVAAVSNEARIIEALQKSREVDSLSAQITQLVRSSRYPEAETQLEALLSSKQMASDGHRLLERVYFQLASTELPAAWDAWCQKRPQSHFPFTVRGMHFYEKARSLDGANQTLLLTERQRQAFNTYLKLALADLEKAYQLNPGDPGPPATLTALSIHAKSSRADMEHWYQISTANDPDWLTAHRAKLIYLAPWRHGSEQLMYQFAVECFRDDRADATRYVIALDYLNLHLDRLGETLNAEQFLLKPETYSMMLHGLDRYIRDFPDSSRIEQYRALQERAIAQPYVAIAAFSDALISNPDNGAARMGRVSAYLAVKQYDEAEADLLVLRRSDTDIASVLARLGFISFHRDRSVDGSAALYEQALEHETCRYLRKQIYFERGTGFQNFGKHQRAIADYSAALIEDPLFEEAYIGRAVSLYSIGDLEGALADLVTIKSTIRGRLTTKARSLINTYLQPRKQNQMNQRPDSLTAGRTDTDLQSGGRSENIPQGQDQNNKRTSAQVSDQQSREYLLRGLRSYYRGSIEQARNDFYRVISRSPEEAKAYFMLGQIAEEQEINLTKAHVFYRQALRLAPEVADYNVAVARCLYRQQDFSRAAALLSAFIETKKPDGASSAQLYFLRGLCLEELGLIPEALDDMRQSLRLDPEIKAARLFIRDHTRHLGQNDRGGAQPAEGPEKPPEQLSRAGNAEQMQLDSASPEGAAQVDQLIEQGRQYLLQGDVKQAKISYFKAVRIDQRRSEPHHLLGRLFFEYEQDYPKALLYYNQAIEKDQSIAQYFFDRAAIHFYYKQYGPAREDFTSVLKLQPDNYQSLYYRGVCNHMLGLKAQARADFNKIRESGDGLDMEIERFRNAWKAEIDQFLDSET